MRGSRPIDPVLLSRQDYAIHLTSVCLCGHVLHSTVWPDPKLKPFGL